jgi:hypothetical protein
VIFGKRRWLKWTLTVVVLAVTGMCCVYLLGGAKFCTIVSGIFADITGLLLNLADLASLTTPSAAYLDKVYDLSTHSAAPTTLTWAACSLLLNTVLSTSIIAKIV